MKRKKLKGGMLGKSDQAKNDNQTDSAATDTSTDITVPATAEVETNPISDSAVPSDAALAVAMPDPEVGVNGVSVDTPQTEPMTPLTPAPPPAEPVQAPAEPVQAPIEPPATAPAAPVSDDLAQIKQQALQSLEPLIGKLEQSADEKFRTLMMLIQASDNSQLIKDAYAAASQITDEKARAHALLDVVNEINYFKQQQAQNNKQ